MTVTTLESYHRNIRVERDGHVITLTIDRPASKNGCTGAMWVAIGRVFREISFSGARVAVITGADGNFCSGADLGSDPGSGEIALSITKRELDAAGDSSLAQALELEALGQGVNVKTDDMREAFVAYAERRPPEFTGR